MNQLITRWRTFDINASPYVHPEDENKLGATFVNYDYSTYLLEGLEQQSDPRFHLGLLPQPFHGDLKNATVFLLMLNPGLNPGDYFAEAHVPAYRKALVENLQQKAGRHFPLIFLDPQFAWHPGARFFRGKLNWLAHELVRTRSMPYSDALSFLAQKVCCLELVPYHSVRFSLAQRVLRTLPSVISMRAFVNQELAHRPETLLIVMRQAASWGLVPHKNCVVYDGSATRAAHLSKGSAGGEALIRHFGLNAG